MNNRSPLTPMTNLKLLTRVASMEESLPSKKILFHPEDKENNPSTCSQTNLRRCYSENVDHSTKVSSKVAKKTLKRYKTFCNDENLSIKNGIQDLGNLRSISEKALITQVEYSRKYRSLGSLTEK